MTVSFEKISKGLEYERPQLAELWGYKGFQAISRGVVTPSQTNYIILFVTEEKQASLTQYNDYLEDGELHWEGEAKHSSDQRILGANRSNDEIHLFHRKKHHSPFKYLGQVKLNEHNLRVDEPSQFIFTLSNELKVEEPVAGYESEFAGDLVGLEETERNALRTSRIGQGVFRDGVFRLWGACAVTGYSRPTVLLASHIKPWRDSTNIERLDPHNGLLLQPTIDKLFDRGLVSFDDAGKLIRASSFTTDELAWLGVDPDASLRRLPERTIRYLRYHREYEFERTDA
ncbi:MAG: HNH endonuclease [Burkholderiaceae bacterium]